MRWFLIALCLILMLATTASAHPNVRSGYQQSYAVYQVQRPVVYAVQYQAAPVQASYSYQSSYSYSSATYQGAAYGTAGVAHTHAPAVRLKLFRPFRARVGAGCGC